MSTQPRDVKEKTLKDIHDLGLVWLRDAPTSGSQRAIANFVEEIAVAKKNQLKVLAIIMPMDEDYDGALPINRCGWREKRLSQINLTKYAKRLQTLFGAVKAAGLSIDAFEFGGEFDQYCYDADVPRGHAGSATPGEIKTWLKGYGRFLQTGAAIAHASKYFPQAKIITFGMAHSGDSRSGGAFPAPARYVAMLRDVDGVNYLKDVDGYGTHLYPSPNDIVNSVRHLLGEDVAALGRDRPIWITEWGFLEIRAFPNRSGRTLPQCVQTFLDVLDEARRDIPIGPAMYFRYDVWLTDATGKPLPQADVLAAYMSGKPALH
ncbi:hypothetical protein [Bradyrhizobium sp. ARR65]|uniref:hypothetical protein n=1 Tax=Bradyrhizobium sp. ARR65 TaxID=1040989 RepID=UPI0012FC44FD|nr:hypothetical protein [Bradyrhizobium sp. ARR65]